MGTYAWLRASSGRRTWPPTSPPPIPSSSLIPQLILFQDVSAWLRFHRTAEAARLGRITWRRTNSSTSREPSTARCRSTRCFSRLAPLPQNWANPSVIRSKPPFLARAACWRKPYCDSSVARRTLARQHTRKTTTAAHSRGRRRFVATRRENFFRTPLLSASGCRS